jgi:L-asparaginase II
MRDGGWRTPDALLATVERSGCVESVHRGAAVVVGRDGIVHAWGDPAVRVFTRSAIKPLQALPVLERGIAARLGFTDRELAVISASHSGTVAHVEVVRGILAKGGFGEERLLCGPHAPFDRQTAHELARTGGPSRIHNNCSGKHAGFLHLAADLGADLADYLQPHGPAQALVRRTVAEMAGIAAEEIEVGLDGCGAPTLRFPLVALARAFYRLANPEDLPAERAAACRALFAAVNREPFFLAGPGRLCTRLIESARGRLYPKNGAEGVYAVGIAGAGGAGYGFAVKVEDGSERGYVPVVVDALHRLGVWAEVPAAIADAHRVPLRNTQNLVVGQVRSALAWSP